jgi:hypothetical protein
MQRMKATDLKTSVRGTSRGRRLNLKMKFVLDMFRVATTITNGKAEITFRKRRRVSIFEKSEVRRETRQREGGVP